MSLPDLLSLSDFTFNPILNNGEVIGLTINDSEGKLVLSIKDSFKEPSWFISQGLEGRGSKGTLSPLLLL